MPLVLLNVLLMLLGPFAVVLPLAAIAWMQFSPRPARVRPVRFRLPAIRLAVP